METSSNNVNGMALASLIASVVAFFAFWPLGILGIYFGRRAKEEIPRTGQEGEGIADAGIIIGWIDVILTILAIIGVLIFVFLVFVIGIGVAAGAAGAA